MRLYPASWLPALSKNRQILRVLLPIFVIAYVALVTLIFQKTGSYAISEAEKDALDALLSHKAVHRYVTETQRPEIYRLQGEDLLYKEYFSPKVMSFTFIARSIKQLINQEREKVGLPALYFKLAADNPRNPINQADEFESALLARMNRGEVTEIREVVQQNGIPTLHVAVPIDRSTPGCLKCHGDPKNAPAELIKLYGSERGFYENPNNIRALISIRVPLAPMIRDANQIARVIAWVALLIMTMIYGVVHFFVLRIDKEQRSVIANKRFVQATLDGLTAHICVLDQKGIVIAVNRAWQEYADSNEGDPLRVRVGANYVVTCDVFVAQSPGEVGPLAAGLRDVLAHRVDVFDLEYSVASSLEPRWFMVRISRLPGESPVHVVVAHENITKRKQAEQQLQVKKDYAENLIRTANVMVVELDLAGNVKLLNPAAEQITGYKAEELVGLNWFETLVPRTRYPAVWKMFQELSVKGVPKRFENPISTKTGEEHYIIWQNSEMTENGNIVGVVSFGMDVTENRRINQRLSEQDVMLRNAQYVAHVGTWRLEHSDQRLTWSDEMFNIYEIANSEESLSHSTWLAAIHPEDRARVESTFDSSIKNGIPYDITYRLLLPSGAEKYVHEHSECQFDSDGHPHVSVGVIQDVTKQVLNELSLRESEVRFRTIADYTYDWEYWQGVHGEILYINAACQSVSGYSQAEFISRPALLDEIVYPEDRQLLLDHKEKIQHEASCSLEYRIVTKEGQVRWVWHGCRAVFGADGKPSGRRVSNRDITDRKNTEELVRRLAFFDTLTDLPNRRMLQDRLQQGLSQAKRFNRSLAIMFLDLDRFKQINDTLGHDVGDELLKEVSKRLAACVRVGDTVARTGGDEFVIVLSEISQPADINVVADKILLAFTQPFELAGNRMQVTTSIGISIYPVSGTDDAQALMKKADAAMYEAKASGRNAYRFYEGDAPRL